MSLPHTVTVELYYSGGWNVLTGSALIRTPLSWSRAWSPTTLEPTAAQLTGSITDEAGTYNPLNPNSVLYGLVGRNTPIRVSVDGDVRWTGEASWRPGRTLGADRWVEFTAGGVVQRLGRGASPLSSPLSRGLTGSDPVGWWPLDDGVDAVAFRSGLVGGTPMVADGVKPAQSDGPPGAAGKYPAIMEGGAYVGTATAQVSMAATGTWTVEAWVRAGVAAGVTDATAFFLGWRTTGRYTYWNASVEMSPTSSGLLSNADTADGASSYIGGAMLGSLRVFDGNWHRIRVTAEQVGSSADFTTYVDDVSVATGTVASTTIGTVTEVFLPHQWWNSGYAPADVDAIHVAQLAVWDSSPDDLYPAGTGHVGEFALDRIERLCDEEGVPVATVGAATDTAPMGVQPSATLLDLLCEAARTDGGILHEQADSIGLRYVALAELCRQTPAVTLAYEDDLVPTLRAVLDDQGVRNDVTASSERLGSARVVISAGPLGTESPPAGVGRYDTTLNVNPADVAQLRDAAGWFAASRTSDRPPVEGLAVDLDASPTVDVAAIEIGSVIEIDGFPDDPNPLILLVTGIAETATNHRRTVALETVPAAPYDIGLLDTAGLLDCGACTTNESLDVTETGIDVLIADACTWTHASGDYGILVGGELMTVTAVSAVGGILGAYTQTLTVTRSVNGVVKTHATGAPVHVADPFILARS